MERGLHYHRKPKEPKAAKEIDLSSTSGARHALETSRRKNTPEAHAELEKKISQLHPDLLIERRNVS